MSLSSRGSENEVFETSSPAYTNITVRRAFIVWLHCGQANKFRDVCNYYHVLEKLEEELSPDRRATSRHHEFNLFSNPPPKSAYLTTHHPTLYNQTQLNDYYIAKVEAIRNDKCVFKLDGFKELGSTHGVTKKQIVATSRLIRNYCKSHYITLNKFLEQFKQYTASCNLGNNVQNVWEYIQRQLIKDELIMASNWPASFSFLDDDDDLFAANVPVKNLNNQIRFQQSFSLSPVGVKEIHDYPWRGNKRKPRKMKKNLADKQYRKPGGF